MTAHSRPNVVCLHGLGRTPSDWDGVRPGLEMIGNVLAPALGTEPTAALAAAGRAISDGDIVVGHSMGGVIALQLALQKRRRLRAVVLTSCFYPPARNGRSASESVKDYLAHRIQFARASGQRQRSTSSTGSRNGTALRALIRFAARPGRFDEGVEAVNAPTIALHAQDDHYVPVDFALAVAARHPEIVLRVVPGGGHYPHIEQPELWLATVGPLLAPRDIHQP